ncbi:MAG: PBS lyase [Archangium gephyra]|uniref:PBS lyase n=1 Tax=Archangium gephyra TaxID=48 RepID=A0A2W5SUC5_9BACT|nr:MAG: PBS lyase [Archangium gephyra]
MRRIIVGGLLSVALLTSSCKQDPALPETWSKKISEGKSTKEKVKAVETLREKHMSPAMVPMLEKELAAAKKPEVKSAIARVLGEQKSKSSVDALVEAIDPAASDSETKTLNKEIAVALGNIGDPKALPALTKLLKTKDNFTVLAAIDALGTMDAKDAFDPLYAIATDDAIEPFITKKAIVALGNIGDARAVPGLVKAMFKERKGVSFYMESSFALYQIGTPSADALIPVVEGKDKDLLDWAQKNNIKDVALYAKGTQVLGDLHDRRAEKTIVSFLNFKSDFDDIKLIMRMRAADALGRMRSKEGVKPLAALLDEVEANARREYVWSLARIGGTDAVAKLVETSGKGPWGARDESMRGVAMLGSDPAVFDKASAAEQKLFEAECKDDPEMDECKDVGASVKKHQEKIAAYKLRAAAAAECKTDAACWVKQLDAADHGVRERAAYELGRSGNVAAASELMKRLPETNLDTRLAIIQGIDWLIEDSKDAMAEARKSLPALEKQIADEKGKTEFVKVNEDLRRLLVKLKRG